MYCRKDRINRLLSEQAEVRSLSGTLDLLSYIDIVIITEHQLHNYIQTV